jgi:hypothetical protein
MFDYEKKIQEKFGSQHRRGTSFDEMLVVCRFPNGKGGVTPSF